MFLKLSWIAFKVRAEHGMRLHPRQGELSSSQDLGAHWKAL